jgi:hypothetical protein
VFNAVGVVFKGSGFYRTDSRKPEKSESGTKTDAPKSDAPKSDSPKSDPPAASKAKETATT